MTAALDLAPDAHPVVEGAREMAVALDRMYASAAEPLSVSEVPSVVADQNRIVRRVEAVKLRVLAQGAASSAAADAGFASTGSWLAQQTRTTGRDASRQVALAGRLESAQRTGAALAAGDLSADHAAVVTDALSKLPDRVIDEQRSLVEAELVCKAARLDPGELRKHARRALAAIEPDPAVVDAHENALLASEEEAARAKTKLMLHDNGDGTTSGHFTVPSLAGDILRKVLDAMTAPRRQGARAVASDRAPLTDWAQRRGAAFVELLEHLPTDHLHLKTAATVVVQLRHEALLGALAAAGVDTDQPISAGTARRLACTAGVVPTVLGGASLPLDLGREQRLFTEAQRVALAGRHTHCAAEGCQRPFAWCELHHRKPWSKGGRTDLDQAVPLCAYHHHLIHDDSYHHRDGPDGIVFTRIARSAQPNRARSPMQKPAATRPPPPATRPRLAAPMRT